MNPFAAAALLAGVMFYAFSELFDWSVPMDEPDEA